MDHDFIKFHSEGQSKDALTSSAVDQCPARPGASRNSGLTLMRGFLSAGRAGRAGAWGGAVWAGGLGGSRWAAPS